MECEDDNIEDHIIESETDTDDVTLPEKSKYRYEIQYDTFVKWQEERGMNDNFSEAVVIAFFDYMSINRAPTTLWSSYSMLRSMILLRNKIDISKYENLLKFIKSKNDGYVSPKPKIFTDEQISKFINEAPDHLYLATKVVLIFNLMGACKTDELVEMTMGQIENHGSMYLVKVPNMYSKTERTFTITDQYSDIVRKYIELRPPLVKTDRFFLNYQKGKCTVQHIGKNKFTYMPKQIATYLELEEAERYTGLSIRKTTTTVFSNIATKKRRSSRRHESSTNQRSNNKKKVKREKSTEESSSDISDDTMSCSSFNDHTNFTPPSPNARSPVITRSFSMADPLSLDGDQSSFNNITSVVESEQENRTQLEKRMDLLNKHFVFENCTNIHITFK